MKQRTFTSWALCCDGVPFMTMKSLDKAEAMRSDLEEMPGVPEISIEEIKLGYSRQSNYWQQGVRA